MACTSLNVHIIALDFTSTLNFRPTRAMLGQVRYDNVTSYSYKCIFIVFSKQRHITTSYRARSGALRV